MLLTFGSHIQNIWINATARQRVLTSLTSKKRVKKVYKALQLSLINYGAPAWESWAEPSDIAHLELVGPGVIFLAGLGHPVDYDATHIGSPSE